MSVAPVPSVSTVTTPGTWRPTMLQELVLDAALTDRDRAESAFARWVAATDFDDVDAGSYRVLPLVAARFEEFGIIATWSAHLRGILRRSWYENHVMLHATLSAVDALEDAGIDVVVLKGGSLAVLAYPGIGTRPMDDLDLLVPEDRAADALGVLLGAGWELEPGGVPPALLRGEVPDAFRSLRHSVGLRGPGGFEMDLHWHATDAWCWPGADLGLWSATRPFELQGRSLRGLAAADELLVACVHGMRPNVIAPIRWVADAVLVLRSEPIVWERVVDRARELLVEPHLGVAVDYLRDRFDAPIPGWVVGALRERRLDYFERQWLDSCRRDGAARSLGAHYGRYLRGVRTEVGFQRYVGGLPEHLVYLLGCDSTRDLPAEIGRRATGRIRKSPQQSR